MTFHYPHLAQCSQNRQTSEGQLYLNTPPHLPNPRHQPPDNSPRCHSTKHTHVTHTDTKGRTNNCLTHRLGHSATAHPIRKIWIIMML